MAIQRTGLRQPPERWTRSGMLRLLDTDAPDDRGKTEVDDEDETSGDRPRIRCPLCYWVPRASDRWFCYCGCSWNTFETGGCCPECAFQWNETKCLACDRWSKHQLWYARDEE